jgi:hypothetical protein
MTPQIDLDELQRLLDAATPGEWLAHSAYISHDDGSWSITSTNSAMEVVDGYSDPSMGDNSVRLSRADAEFIAVAHNALPALIVEVRRLRELVKDHGKGAA